jgi:hypothetical protein
MLPEGDTGDPCPDPPRRTAQPALTGEKDSRLGTDVVAGSVVFTPRITEADDEQG